MRQKRASAIKASLVWKQEAEFKSCMNENEDDYDSSEDGDFHDVDIPSHHPGDDVQDEALEEDSSVQDQSTSLSGDAASTEQDPVSEAPDAESSGNTVQDLFQQVCRQTNETASTSTNILSQDTHSQIDSTLRQISLLQQDCQENKTNVDKLSMRNESLKEEIQSARKRIKSKQESSEKTAEHLFQLLSGLSHVFSTIAQTHTHKRTSSRLKPDDTQLDKSLPFAKVPSFLQDLLKK